MNDQNTINILTQIIFSFKEKQVFSLIIIKYWQVLQKSTKLNLPVLPDPSCKEKKKNVKASTHIDYLAQRRHCWFLKHTVKAVLDITSICIFLKTIAMWFHHSLFSCSNTEKSSLEQDNQSHPTWVPSRLITMDTEGKKNPFQIRSL